MIAVDANGITTVYGHPYGTWCSKTKIKLKEVPTEAGTKITYVMIGYNPNSTLYPVDDFHCGWYVFEDFVPKGVITDEFIEELEEMQSEIPLPCEDCRMCRGDVHDE